MKKLFSLLLCLLLCLSTLPQLALAEEDVTLSGEGQTGGAGDGATDPDTGPVAPGSPD